MVEYAFDLSARLGIDTLVVNAGEAADKRLVERFRDNQKVVWLVDDQRGKEPLEDDDHNRMVRIPGTAQNGIDSVMVGLIAAVLRQHLDVDQSVICLAGLHGSRRLDNLSVMNPRRDIPWFRDHRITRTSKRLASNEGIRLLELSLRFALEGREGKPIGTVFLLGNVRNLRQMTRPLILNPLSGHPASARSIFNPDFLETIRELSALDGAFLVNTRGGVEQAGVYLDAPPSKQIRVGEGLGSRHVAAATITAQTNAIAFVISESSGRVSVFTEGAAVMELDARVVNQVTDS